MNYPNIRDIENNRANASTIANSLIKSSTREERTYELLKEFDKSLATKVMKKDSKDEESSQNDRNNMLIKAILDIQRVWRGYQGRKIYIELLYNLIEKEETQEREKLQRMVETGLVQMNTTSMTRKMEEDVFIKKQRKLRVNYAATRIQRWFRRRQRWKIKPKNKPRMPSQKEVMEEEMKKEIKAMESLNLSDEDIEYEKYIQRAGGIKVKGENLFKSTKHAESSSSEGSNINIKSEDVRGSKEEAEIYGNNVIESENPFAEEEGEKVNESEKKVIKVMNEENIDIYMDMEHNVKGDEFLRKEEEDLKRTNERIQEIFADHHHVDSSKFLPSTILPQREIIPLVKEFEKHLGRGWDQVDFGVTQESTQINFSEEMKQEDKELEISRNKTSIPLKTFGTATGQEEEKYNNERQEETKEIKISAQGSSVKRDMNKIINLRLKYNELWKEATAKMKVLGELREENDILKDGLQESKQEIQELITRMNKKKGLISGLITNAITFFKKVGNKK